MIINSKNGMQTGESLVEVEHNDIKAIKIKDTNRFVDIDFVPYINVAGVRIYYITRGNTTYVVQKDYEYNIQSAYVFEQVFKDNRLKIENVYTTTVITDNYPLITLMKYSKDYEKANLLEILPNILGFFKEFVEPVSIREQLKEVLENRLKEERPQPEQAKEIKKPKPFVSRKPHELKFGGKYYKNLKEFSSAYGMPYKVIWKKHKKEGKSLEELVERYGGVINE